MTRMAAVLILLPFLAACDSNIGPNQPIPIGDVDELARQIGRDELHSFDDVLERLVPAMRSHFTMLYHSRSSQGATPVRPRIILFGYDARFIVAFNGFSDVLEIMQYRAAQRRFDLYQVTHDAPSRLRLSHRNPRRCLGCHQSDPRPNWDYYDRWEGAIGSDDDVPTGEENGVLRALFSRNVLGVYAFLKPLPGSDVSPYETSRKGRLRFRPNLRLMALAIGLNANRLARLLESHPRYSELQYLFLASRLRCFMDGVDAAAEVVRLFGAPAANSPLGGSTEVSVERLYAYVARAAGLSDADWSISFGEGTEPQDGWGPYSYFLGAATFDRHAFLQADAVASRIAQRLASRWRSLRTYVRLTPIATERFAKDPEDLFLASVMDGQLEAIDFQRLREACPLLIQRYRTRYLKRAKR